MLQADQRRLLKLFGDEHWDSDRLLEWLIDEFKKPDNDRKIVSFSPLTIDPSRERTSQVIVALLEIANEDLAFSKILRDALQNYVSDAAEAVRADIPYAKDLWSLYAQFGAADKIERTARNALFQNPESDMAQIVISTMLLKRIPADAKTTFLEDLRDPGNFRMGGGKYWRDAYFMHIVDARLGSPSHPNERQAAWSRILSAYGNEVTAALSPETPVGRANIRSVARQITGNKIGPSKCEETKALGELLLQPETTVADINAFVAKLG